jgi:putative endonuclease
MPWLSTVAAYQYPVRNHSGRYYTGFSEDLDSQLSAHNTCKENRTKKFHPWRIKTAIAFTDRQQTKDFEYFLKSPSGRAFFIGF